MDKNDKKKKEPEAPKVDVEKVAKQPTTEDEVEPEVTDNQGVTHISPPCNEG